MTSPTDDQDDAVAAPEASGELQPPAVGPGPIGGEATVAASSWGGASDEEMDDLRRSEQDRADDTPA